MPRSKTDKSSLLTALKAHVLEHGLNTASLRPMAAAAGTSDRMLIYHFGSKDGLISALLEALAVDMELGLDAALPNTRFDSERELATAVVGLMRSTPFRPYVRVWLDIVSAAAQGNSAHVEAGKAVIDGYVDWLAVRHPKGAAGAPALLTFIEGVLIMDMVGQSNLVDAALATLPE